MEGRQRHFDFEARCRSVYGDGCIPWGPLCGNLDRVLTLQGSGPRVAEAGNERFPLQSEPRWLQAAGVFFCPYEARFCACPAYRKRCAQ